MAETIDEVRQLTICVAEFFTFCDVLSAPHGWIAITGFEKSDEAILISLSIHLL